ncbi:hypothetical protein [Pseudonocardia sp. Ae707_Ps2]
MSASFARRAAAAAGTGHGSGLDQTRSGVGLGHRLVLDDDDGRGLRLGH